MTCSLCRNLPALAQPQADGTGLLVFMCVECATLHARPRRFPEATQPGLERMEPRTDFANHVGAMPPANDNELHIAVARAEAAVDCLRSLVKAWSKEMEGGHATMEQQWVLRRAKELIG